MVGLAAACSLTHKTQNRDYLAKASWKASWPSPGIVYRFLSWENEAVVTPSPSPGRREAASRCTLLRETQRSHL